MLKHVWMLALAALWLAPACQGFEASSAVPQAGGAFAIDVWETEDGLPQHSIVAITQTKDGYLWLGTLKGLVRFDGMRFTVFDEDNTPGLSSSRIVHLFEDREGNLWIGTEAAGVILAKKDGQLKNLDIGRGSPEGRLMAACEDSDGAVWLYTADGQLCRHRNGRVDVFRFGTEFVSIYRSVITAESGRVLVGTDQRVYAIGPTAGLDPKVLPKEQEWPVNQLGFLLASRGGGHWRLADERVQKWTTNGVSRDLGPYPWRGVRVSAACEDAQGNLLVGTLGAGVFWFDAEGNYVCLSTNQGLSHNIVLSLQLDREGALWVGTDGGGLNRVRRQVFEVLEPSRGLVAQSVCEDSRGGIWVGYNGGGIDHWNKAVLERYSSGQAFRDQQVRAVITDQHHRVWAGTFWPWNAGLFHLFHGRFERFTPAPVVNRNVFALYEDRLGRLWVGTSAGLMVWDGGEWKAFTTREGLSANEVRAIAEDKEGILWIGTRGGGLNLLRDDKVTALRNHDELSGEDISSLHVDDENVLWVGTDGRGLARFHAGKWTHYSKHHGLVSNSLGYLLEDDQGYLWIGSNAGLMRVLKKALNDFANGRTAVVPVRLYGKREGLPIAECTSGSQPGACRTQDGKLWFPTIRGLAFVNPAELRPNTNPPPVIIESVAVDSQPQGTKSLRAPRLEALTMPPGKERLDIQYTALNFGAPERARFRYRLEGHEKDWIETGDDRVARYSKLPPGQYRFHVTAANEDGVWNETGSSLALIVQPPFWRTWWFLTTTAVCLLTAMIAVVRYFSVQKLERQLAVLRQQEVVEKERGRIARDIHDQLGASLTQVALLGEMVAGDKHLPDEVESHARQISQTARETTRTLDEIVWTVNPANDTLEGLINYVCKYAQEFLTIAGLRYRFEVPPELPARPIAPEVRHNVFLAAKEAVTNVVRHADASSAWIRLNVELSRFTLEIADDGRGLVGLDEKRAATRNGLRNMRKRMEDIGGEFSMDSAPEGGLRVRFIVPSKDS